MADAFATLIDVCALFRPLNDDEQVRAAALLPVVSDMLRQEAINRGRNLDKMISKGEIIPSVLKSVVVDVVSRTILTSTDAEPMTQITESAGGYSVSGSFLSPGGGVFIKNSELKRLGLTKQRYGMVDMYGTHKRN